MARRVDLTGENITRKNRKERNYGTKTDLASTTVERGSTHWTTGSTVYVDGLLAVAGTATVSGVLSVTGTLNASGQINLSGSTSVTGPMEISGTTTITGSTNILGELNVTGPTTLDGILDIGGDTTITGLLAVDGPTTISGTLDIQGRTTVKNDLELLTGGVLKAGVTKIEPNGKATFGDVVIDPNSIYMIQAPGGNMVSGSGGDSIALSSSTSSSVALDSTGATLDFLGTSTVKARANGIDLTATKIWVRGELESTQAARFPQIFIGSASEITNQRLRISGLPSIQGVQSNVYFNPANGLFFHIT
ncbi:hypothetical protein [Glutamicibacter arilaitensis]|uniref:hypothetical protein n=1 Tax=Glutamicibacter arilaitensis TaxID=256701 RepID=UPI00384BFDE9